tara:strand:+ start:8506 stop:8736 length:231 start_codon:yes stop_codon:yes gene_type:complete
MKTKEYLFNFVGGGWNSVMAKTLPGARKLVKSTYPGTTTAIIKNGSTYSRAALVPILDSVRLSTKKDYDAHMAMFD